MRTYRDKQKTLAVLIDAENTSFHAVRALLHRAGCYGTLAVKRAYGDWSRPHLQRARDIFNSFGIEPVLCPRRATGKNASDLIMALDAMDLLHTGMFDGFCLGSSDSDFTTLAMRMRQDGVKVYGFGRGHTPQGYVAACDKFIYLESLETA